MKAKNLILSFLLLTGVIYSATAQYRPSVVLKPKKPTAVITEDWEPLNTIAKIQAIGLTVSNQNVITPLPAQIGGLFDFQELVNAPYPGHQNPVGKAIVFRLENVTSIGIITGVSRMNEYGLPEPGVYRVEYSAGYRKVRYFRLY